MAKKKKLKYDREDLKCDLQEWVVTVFFEKKDGSLRKMRCTLAESVIPDTGDSDRAESPDTLSVWDLDKEDWRSFRLDKIRSIRYDSAIE